MKKSSTDEMKLGSFITDMLTLVGKVLGPSIPAYVQACACEVRLLPLPIHESATQTVSQ